MTIWKEIHMTCDLLLAKNDAASLRKKRRAYHESVARAGYPPIFRQNSGVA